jgi:hypothetical protein
MSFARVRLWERGERISDISDQISRDAAELHGRIGGDTVR